MYQSDRVNTLLTLREDAFGARVVKLRSLKIEEARDDLEVVLHAMVDLLQQYFFLAKRCVDLLCTSRDSCLQFFSIRDVSNDLEHFRRDASCIPHGGYLRFDPAEAPVLPAMPVRHPARLMRRGGGCKSSLEP